MNEYLAKIRFIKMYSWEKPLTKLIAGKCTAVCFTRINICNLHFHLYFAGSRQSKNKQTKKQKIHSKRDNTIPAAMYITHTYGND